MAYHMSQHKYLARELYSAVVNVWVDVDYDVIFDVFDMFVIAFWLNLIWNVF